MTKNETIVRWLGWTWDEDTGAWFAPPPMQHYQITTPSFDRIGDWHGDDGLLAEIGRRGGDKDSLSRDLHREWMSQRVEAEDPPFDRQMPYADEIAAAYLRATPAQLAAALVKVIEEEE